MFTLTGARELCAVPDPARLRRLAARLAGSIQLPLTQFTLDEVASTTSRPPSTSS